MVFFPVRRYNIGVPDKNFKQILKKKERIIQMRQKFTLLLLLLLSFSFFLQAKEIFPEKAFIWHLILPVPGIFTRSGKLRPGHKKPVTIPSI